MIESCISYPGSKRKCIDMIMDLIPDGIEDWREPFMGSLSVTLGFLQSEKSKDCKRFVTGDLAPEIWALWAGIQKDTNKVCEIIETWWNEKVPSYEEAISRGNLRSEENKDFFDKYEKEGRTLWKWSQEVDCSKLTLEERAARTWIVNRISFSAMGDSGSISLDNFMGFRLEHMNKIRDVSPLLQKLEIINAPFQVTMKDLNKDKSFVFLDPPYANQEKSGLYGRNGDTHHGFPHKEFAELCKQTEAKWLITYDDSIFVRKLFKSRKLFIVPFRIVYTMAKTPKEDSLAGEELFIANYDIRPDSGSYDAVGNM